MSTVAGSALPSGGLPERAEVSLSRLYTLRVSYLILSVGLGVYIWPMVIHHTSRVAVVHGSSSDC
jgi:hypothetical protein